METWSSSLLPEDHKLSIIKRKTSRESSEINEEKQSPDLNFSGVSRCDKGIYEMQDSILRNPIMAETAQKGRKDFHVSGVRAAPGSSGTEAKLKLAPKTEQFVGCWAPSALPSH